MTQLVLICFVFSCSVLIVTISAVITADAPEVTNEYGKDDFQCYEKNAVKTNCATNCELDRCPVTEHYSKVCDKDTCTPGCKCRFNEKFAENGTCIATQRCPPFSCGDRPYEEFVACPPYCSESCSQKGCPTFGFLLMVVECFPECRCKQGFSRKGGACVPNDDC